MKGPFLAPRKGGFGRLLKRGVEKVFCFAVIGAAAVACAPCLSAWVGSKFAGEGRKIVKRQYYKIPPRVSRRKRGLRVLEKGKKRKRWGLSLLGARRRVQVEEQEESLWFRVPYEVRRMIYAEYFGGEGGVVCVTFAPGLRMVGLCGRRRRGEDGDGFAAYSVDVLSLLRTCRKIYTEALPLLYSIPTYKFVNPIAFLIFSATITQHAFHSLRNVFLDFSNVPYPSTYSHLQWPEPPPRIESTPCIRKKVPAIRTPLLERPKNYLNFRLSRARMYLNPLVFKAGGRTVMRRSEDSPSIWKWTCDVLGEMHGLRRLEITIRHDLCVGERSIHQVFGTAGIAAENHDGLQNFVVRIYGPTSYGEEDPGEVETWRRTLVGNEGRWIKIPKSS
ncbi:hypothetical protein BDV96DRAFT_594195 [Lophiotrema nucula]|uniref:DUF7730 domain-containing protein n=1 Tax=Lophiotrema nucula TaxID=690887 RepID=A0A6A5ZTU4_9PLEO|nr:hypothetical protein BDV96DRAFT_594195 [Lophiotrema nucula]